MLEVKDITNTIINDDCLKVMKNLPDNCIDILYTDVPYNMGSLYTIDDLGHYRFRGKGGDFMDKWEAMDGLWWDDWFKEAYRIIKHGGFCITHNVDREADMWTYYSRRNNFITMQKLYWLFITNFPKAVDALSMLEKRENGASELADKYDGYKYGRAALKQILEEILVFMKPSKNSIIEDIIEIDRDEKMGRPSTCHASVINLHATMVAPSRKSMGDDVRHTPQMLVENILAPKMVSKVGQKLDVENINEQLPKIPFTSDDLDVRYNYCPKASKAEKEAGLEDFEVKLNNKASVGTLLNENGKDKWATESKNPHPTPKPLALCEWVLKLFKPPHNILVLDTFAGSGSIPLACKNMGIPYIGIELNEEFHRVAEARLNNRVETLFG